MTDDTLTIAPPGASPSSIRGTAARTRAWPAPTLKWKASSRKRVEVSSRGRGMLPPRLLTMMSTRPSCSCAVWGSEGIRSTSERSPTTTTPRRPRPRGGRAPRARVPPGPGGGDDAGARLGQGYRGGGTDTAPTPRDDGYLVGHAEAGEDHGPEIGRASVRERGEN